MARGKKTGKAGAAPAKNGPAKNDGNASGTAKPVTNSKPLEVKPNKKQSNNNHKTQAGSSTNHGSTAPAKPSDSKKSEKTPKIDTNVKAPGSSGPSTPVSSNDNKKAQKDIEAAAKRAVEEAKAAEKKAKEDAAKVKKQQQKEESDRQAEEAKRLKAEREQTKKDKKAAKKAEQQQNKNEGNDKKGKGTDTEKDRTESNSNSSTPHAPKNPAKLEAKNAKNDAKRTAEPTGRDKPKDGPPAGEASHDPLHQNGKQKGKDDSTTPTNAKGKESAVHQSEKLSQIGLPERSSGMLLRAGTAGQKREAESQSPVTNKLNTQNLTQIGLPMKRGADSPTVTGSPNIYKSPTSMFPNDPTRSILPEGPTRSAEHRSGVKAIAETAEMEAADRERRERELAGVRRPKIRRTNTGAREIKETTETTVHHTVTPATPIVTPATLSGPGGGFVVAAGPPGMPIFGGDPVNVNIGGHEIVYLNNGNVAGMVFVPTSVQLPMAGPVAERQYKTVRTDWDPRTIKGGTRADGSTWEPTKRLKDAFVLKANDLVYLLFEDPKNPKWSRISRTDGTTQGWCPSILPKDLQSVPGSSLGPGQVVTTTTTTKTTRKTQSPAPSRPATPSGSRRDPTTDIKKPLKRSSTNDLANKANPKPQTAVKAAKPKVESTGGGKPKLAINTSVPKTDSPSSAKGSSKPATPVVKAESRGKAPTGGKK